MISDNACEQFMKIQELKLTCQQTCKAKVLKS